MKKVKLFLLSATILSSCAAASPPAVEEKISYDYIEIENSKISWNGILSKEEDTYKVYFYSLSCGYCRELKDEIISYYLKGLETLYFVCTDEHAVFARGDIIGVNNIDDFHILGTPYLVEIKNKTVFSAYAGLTSIRNYLEQATQK